LQRALERASSWTNRDAMRLLDFLRQPAVGLPVPTWS